MVAIHGPNWTPMRVSNPPALRPSTGESGTRMQLLVAPEGCRPYHIITQAPSRPITVVEQLKKAIRGEVINLAALRLDMVEFDFAHIHTTGNQTTKRHDGIWEDPNTAQFQQVMTMIQSYAMLPACVWPPRLVGPVVQPSWRDRIQNWDCIWSSGQDTTTWNYGATTKGVSIERVAGNWAERQHAMDAATGIVFFQTGLAACYTKVMHLNQNLTASYFIDLRTTPVLKSNIQRWQHVDTVGRDGRMVAQVCSCLFTPAAYS